MALLVNVTTGKRTVKIPSDQDQETVTTGSDAVPLDEFYKFWYGDADGGGQ